MEHFQIPDKRLIEYNNQILLVEVRFSGELQKNQKTKLKQLLKENTVLQNNLDQSIPLIIYNFEKLNQQPIYNENFYLTYERQKSSLEEYFEFSKNKQQLSQPFKYIFYVGQINQRFYDILLDLNKNKIRKSNSLFQNENKENKVLQRPSSPLFWGYNNSFDEKNDQNNNESEHENEQEPEKEIEIEIQRQQKLEQEQEQKKEKEKENKEEEFTKEKNKNSFFPISSKITKLKKKKEKKKKKKRERERKRNKELSKSDLIKKERVNITPESKIPEFKTFSKQSRTITGTRNHRRRSRSFRKKKTKSEKIGKRSRKLFDNFGKPNSLSKGNLGDISSTNSTKKKQSARESNNDKDQTVRNKKRSAKKSRPMKKNYPISNDINKTPKRNSMHKRTEKLEEKDENKDNNKIKKRSDQDSLIDSILIQKFGKERFKNAQNSGWKSTRKRKKK